MKNRTFGIAALGVAAAFVLALAGCSDSNSMEGMDHGGGSSESSASSAAASTADVEFVSMMIPHHEQAVEMSDILLAKDGIDERVTNLAQQIKDAQAPEIALMQQWLTDWDAEPMTSMEGMDHGGMMSADDLDDLAAAEGTEAARLFLEQMMEHHRGAVEMAQNQIDAGQNADAVALAETIVDTQSQEITDMENLLQAL